MQRTDGLTRDQLAHYVELGFVRLPGFADRDVCRAAMVFHYAATGTIDLDPGIVNELVTVR